MLELRPCCPNGWCSLGCLEKMSCLKPWASQWVLGVPDLCSNSLSSSILHASASALFTAFQLIRPCMWPAQLLKGTCMCDSCPLLQVGPKASSPGGLYQVAPGFFHDLPRPVDLPPHASVYPFESSLFPLPVSLPLPSPSPVRTLHSFLKLLHPFSFTDLAGVLFLGEAFLGLPAPDTVFGSSRGHSGLSTDCGDQGQICLHLNQKAAPIYSVTSDRSCLIVCINKMKGIPTYMVVIRLQ